MLERGLLEGGLHADPPWHENAFQVGTTPPTQCSESTHGELSATFRGIMRVRTLTHGPSESPFVQLSATFRQVAACFCSRVLRDSYFPHSFGTVSAGLGGGASAKFPQDFPHIVSAGLSAQSFCTLRRVSAQMRTQN